jgi:sugar porter (SP) family MFS transporter
MASAPLTPFMRVVAGVAAVAGCLYGYDTGIISGALLDVADQFKLDHVLQEVVASAILVGATLGGLGCGWFSDRFGRRLAIMALAAIFVAGAVAASLSPNAACLIASRAVLGLAVGGSSQAVPTYIAELAPAAQRGRVVTAFNLAIGIGILIASLVSFGLHGIWSWRWMVGIAAVPAAALGLTMIALPETPRWLAAQDREDDARAALARVRPEDADLDGELEQIRAVARKSETARTRGWRGLAEPWVRPAVVTGLGIAAFTQLSGIEMMIYYSPTLLKGLGFGESGALLTNVGLGAIYLAMTAVGVAIVDRVGRRRLSLAMIPGAALALAAFGLVLAFDATRGSAVAVVGCLFVYMVFNAGGLQVIGWLTGSEVYPLAVRAAGTSAQAGMVWGSDLLVTLTALSLVQALGASGAMWVYAGFNALAWLFIRRFLPELTGHDLEAVEAALRDGRFRPARGSDTEQALQPAEG